MGTRRHGLWRWAAAGSLAAALTVVPLAGSGAAAQSSSTSASVPASGPGAAGAAGADPPAGVTTVPDGTAGRVAGMAIPNVDPQQSDAEVSRLHSVDGLNTVSLFVWWWMPKVDSNFVEACTNPAQQGDQQGCNPTEPDAALQVQIAAARQNGMRVILVPIFYCGTCEGGWRGTAQPSNPGAWFTSYRQFIDHYADLAQQNGASTLFIGSEMDSLESQTAQWQQVASEARLHFSGQIGYEQNWDVLGNAHFLGSVDIIGVSAYFPLDDAQSPSLAKLLGDWTNSHASAYSGRNWVAAVGALAHSTGKPILFGEVGYMSGDYAARQPFLNYQSTINWQLQSDLYQALVETFQGQSWWAGAVWWEWYIPSNGNTDNTRTPRGKTAEVFLQHWYRDGWRPAAPGTPVALSDAQHSPDNGELAPATSTAPSGQPAAQGGSAPAGQPGTSGHPATAGAVSGSRAAGPGAASRRVVPGTARASAPGSGAGGSAPAAGGEPASGTGTPLHGGGRDVALLAGLALAALVLALALYNGVRVADTRRHPPSARVG